MTSVTVVVEGDTDFPIARAVLGLAGLEVGQEIDCCGKGTLDRRLGGYNAAARGSPWVVLRDLDRDAPCPGELVARLLPSPARWMRLRIAVHAGEAWLMADSERLASFLRISVALLPTSPDTIPDPKFQLVNLARRSTKPAIVADMVPKPGLGRKIGPAYEARLIEFALKHWRPHVARELSPSLDRTIRALERFAKELDRA